MSKRFFSAFFLCFAITAFAYSANVTLDGYGYNGGLDNASGAYDLNETTFDVVYHLSNTTSEVPQSDTVLFTGETHGPTTQWVRNYDPHYFHIGVKLMQGSAVVATWYYGEGEIPADENQHVLRHSFSQGEINALASKNITYRVEFWYGDPGSVQIGYTTTYTVWYKAFLGDWYPVQQSSTFLPTGLYVGAVVQGGTTRLENPTNAGFLTSVPSASYSLDQLNYDNTNINGSISFIRGPSDIYDHKINTVTLQIREADANGNDKPGSSWQNTTWSTGYASGTPSYQFSINIPNSRGRYYKLRAVANKDLAQNNISGVVAIPPYAPSPGGTISIIPQNIGTNPSQTKVARYSVSIPITTPSFSASAMSPFLSGSTPYEIVFNSVADPSGSGKITWESGPVISDSAVTGIVQAASGTSVTQVLRAVSSISIKTKFNTSQVQTYTTAPIAPDALKAIGINVPVHFSNNSTNVASLTRSDGETLLLSNSAVGKVKAPGGPDTETALPTTMPTFFSSTAAGTKLQFELTNSAISGLGGAVSIVGSSSTPFKDYENDAVSLRLRITSIGAEDVSGSYESPDITTVSGDLSAQSNMYVADVGNFLSSQAAAIRNFLISKGFVVNANGIPEATYTMQVVLSENVSDTIASAASSNFDFGSRKEYLQFKLVIDNSVPTDVGSIMTATYGPQIYDGNTNTRHLDSVSSFTNTASVGLKISIGDSGGSAIRRVTVWNESTSNSPTVYTTIPATINWSLLPTLNGTVDGPRKVLYRVEDFSGNIVDGSFATVLKTTVPSSVTIADLKTQHRYEVAGGLESIYTKFRLQEPYGHNKVLIKTTAGINDSDWDSASSIAEAIPGNLSGDNTNNVEVSFAYPPNGLSMAPGNTPYNVYIYVKDAAENVSSAAIFTYYTKPIRGSVNSIAQTPTPSNGAVDQYQLKFNASPGQASSQAIRILGRYSAAQPYNSSAPEQNNTIGSGASVDYPVLAGTATIGTPFTLPDYKHGQILYELVAYNGIGDQDPVTITLPDSSQLYTFRNLAPYQPVLLSPALNADGTVWANKDSVLSWDSVRSGLRDPEGDVVSYTLFVGPGSAPNTWYPIAQTFDQFATLSGAVQDYLTSHAIDNPVLNSILLHGSTFSWKVDANDQTATATSVSTSDIRSATVDNIAPQVTYAGKSAGQYAVVGNDLSFVFKVKEDDSGLVRNNSDIPALSWTLNKNGTSGASGQWTSDVATADGLWHAIISPDHWNTSDVLSSGIYRTSIQALDRAGNGANGTGLNIPTVIDRDAPVISSVSANDVRNGLIVARTDSVGIDITASDITTGIESIDYAVVANRSGFNPANASLRTLSGSGWTIGQTIAFDGKLRRNINVHEVPDGASVYVALRARDFAGNVSAWMWLSSDPLIVDRRSPDATVSVKDRNSGKTVAYMSSLSRLADNDVQIVTTVPVDLAGTSKSFAIENADTGEQFGTWQNAVTGFKNLSVSNGSWYILVLRSESQTGVTSFASSQPFMVDSRQPSSLLVTGSPIDTAIPGQRLRWSIEALTEGSPITDFAISFTRAPDSTPWDMVGVRGATQTQNGATTVGSISYGAVRTADLVFELPASVPDGTFNAVVTLKDAAGHVVSLTDNTIRFSVQRRDTLIVKDQGPWGQLDPNPGIEGNHVRAQWYYSGQGNVVSIKYRLKANGIDASSWLNGDPSNDTLDISKSVVAGLVVQADMSYTVEVQVNLAGGASVVATSAGITFDSAPPVFRTGSVAIPDYIASTAIVAGWEVSDPESGVKELRAQLRLLKTGTNGEAILIPVSDWVSLGSEGTISNKHINFDTNLGLTTGDRLVVAIEATDRAGFSREVLSNTAVLANLAPPKPLVTDLGDYLNPSPHEVIRNGQLVTIDGDSFSASWKWSRKDPYSPTTYRYALIRQSDAGVDENGYSWSGIIPSDSLQEVTFAPGALAEFSQNDTIVLAVQAINGAGLRSTSYSDGMQVDNTGPYLPAVDLVPLTAVGGKRQYLNPQSPHELEISASEGESSLASVSAEVGIWSEQGSFIGISEVGSADITNGNVPNIPVASAVYSTNNLGSDGTIVVFRASATNSTGTVASRLTQGVMIDNTVPRVANVLGYFANGMLHFSWDLFPGFAPLSRLTVKLFNQTTDSTHPLLVLNNVDGTERSLNVNLSDVPGATNGKYRVFVTAESENGSVSNESGSSNIVFVDTTVPIADLNRSKTPAFIDSAFAINLYATDPESDIAAYEYSVGTLDDMFAYQFGWTEFVAAEEGTTVANPVIDISALGKGLPQDKSKAYVYWRAKNNVGLWSTPVIQSRKLLVDHTAPVAPSVGTPTYNQAHSSVSGISVSGNDLDSGVKSYRLKVVREADKTATTSLAVAETVVNDFDDVPSAIDLRNVVASSVSPEMSEDGYYYVAIQVRNGAGTWSPVGFSNVFQIDTTDPTIRFLSSADYPSDNPANAIIINSGTVSVPYEMSEDVTHVTFVLIDDAGAAYLRDFERNPGYQIHQVNPEFHPTYTFNQQIAGSYSLAAILTDKAGRKYTTTLTERKVVRLNAAPLFTVPGTIETTPGNNLNIPITDIIDLDGDNKSIKVSITYPDGSVETLEYNGPDSTAWVSIPVNQRPTGNKDFKHRFFHDFSNDPYPQVSQFLLLLSVEDSKGKKSAIVPVQIKVHNTYSGTVYANEFWRDWTDINGAQHHRISGDITIPSGLQVTILPSSHIDIMPDESQETNHALLVQGSLVSSDGVTWAANLATNQLWKGIIVENTATLIGNDIANAERAVAIGPNATVQMLQLRIHDGLTGLHILRDNQVVQGLTFASLKEYGIKLEPGIRAIVKDNTFISIRRLFYDPVKTILTIGELNALNGNSGNRVQQ